MKFLIPTAVQVTPEASPGFVDQILGLFTIAGIPILLRSGLVLITGVPLTLLLSRWTRRLVGTRTSPQQGMIAGKVVLYSGILIILVTVLQEMGFSLAPLLGAAGILGIALGFAAQTSVSNIISGFFLMAEGPFVVDDIVQVGDLTGRVLSIDMLSVKLRTFDNRFVRIPNENLIKSAFVNLTRFPIRRADITVGVAYKEDVARVKEILFEVARAHPGALMEPEPQFFFQDYGASSLDFLFGVWVSTENIFEVRNELRELIKKRFDEEGIEIPFPHRTLYAGAVTEPLPIRILGSERDPGMGEGIGPGNAPKTP
ncbi:MAG: mechanosensitive ion channel family protein [Longimicrobiales bacterium]